MDQTGQMTHRRVLLLALPIIISNLSVPLVGLVDTAVMGRLDDPALIGAVALGATVFSFVFWGFGFLRMGTTGLVAQLFGRVSAAQASGSARQIEQTASELRLMIARNLVLAVVFGLFVILLHQPIGQLASGLMPASDRVEQAMLAYYEIRVLSAPAVLINYVLVGVCVGMQRTGYALVIQLVLNLGNAALSIWLVMAQGWGIAGVAWASVLAELLALFVAIAMVKRLMRGIGGRLERPALKQAHGYLPLMRVNANLFLRTAGLIISFAWFTAQGARFGDLTLAVNAILMNWVHVLAYGLDGFAHAAETLVGSAIGARRADQYRWAIRTTTIWAAITALLYAAIYAFFGEQLVAMLTTIDAVREHAQAYLIWLVLMPLLGVWSYQLDGIFVGSLRTGQMRDAMWVSALVYGLLSLPLMHWWGNHGLWLSISLFFVLRALTLGWFLWRKPTGVSSVVES